MPKRDNLQELLAWCGKHITGDEKGQAQIFLDRLFQPSLPVRWLPRGNKPLTAHGRCVIKRA
jgi:hypothetical protein